MSNSSTTTDSDLIEPIHPGEIDAIAPLQSASPARPDPCCGRSLVMLEGHIAGSDDPEEAEALGWYFASWPTPFADEGAARAHLGDDAIVEAWIADLEPAPEGLHPRFDPDVLEGTIAAVHVPRWTEWEGSRCRRSRSLPGTGSSRQRTRTSWCVDGRAPCGSTSTGGATMRTSMPSTSGSRRSDTGSGEIRVDRGARSHADSAAASRSRRTAWCPVTIHPGRSQSVRVPAGTRHCPRRSGRSRW